MVITYFLQEDHVERRKIARQNFHRSFVINIVQCCRIVLMAWGSVVHNCGAHTENARSSKGWLEIGRLRSLFTSEDGKQRLRNDLQIFNWNDLRDDWFFISNFRCVKLSMLLLPQSYGYVCPGVLCHHGRLEKQGKQADHWTKRGTALLMSIDSWFIQSFSKQSSHFSMWFHRNVSKPHYLLSVSLKLCLHTSILIIIYWFSLYKILIFWLYNIMILIINYNDLGY